MNILVDPRLIIAKAVRSTPFFRGKIRTVRALDRVLRKLFPSPLEVEIEQVKYILQTEDIIDFNTLFLGGYQKSLVDYIYSRLQGHPSVFWDIGANVGTISLPLARLLPETKIMAFEPSPPVYRRLEMNLRLNPELQRRIIAKPWALSDHDGNVEFYVSNELFNSGVGGMGHSHNRVSDAILVPTRRGDSLVDSKEAPIPDMIKVDVEGFEFEVLYGMERMLKRPNNVEIIIEHSLYRFRERGLSKTCVVDYLNKMNFDIRVLVDKSKGNRQMELSDLDRDCDLVALKKNTLG